MSMTAMKLLLEHVITALISCASLCACNHPSPTAALKAPLASIVQTSSSTLTTSSVASETTATPGSLLKKDMAYADARKALLTHDWMPERDVDCKANMGADDAAVCDDMPELSIYSDQGVLVTRFRHGQQQLTISSYGMLSDWRVSGNGSRLRITDWQTSSTTAKDSSTTP